MVTLVGIYLLLLLLISHLSRCVLSSNLALIRLWPLLPRAQLILKSSNLVLAIGIVVLNSYFTPGFLLVLIVLVFQIMLLVLQWTSSCCPWSMLSVWHRDWR